MRYPVTAVKQLARYLAGQGGWHWTDVGRSLEVHADRGIKSPVIRGPWPFRVVVVGQRLDEYVSRWLLQGRQEEGIRVFVRRQSDRPLDDAIVIMPLSGFAYLSELAMDANAERNERERRARE